ncbi:lebercilin-like protein [Agrilus planipennis]|uniref:Lebercilin-like protein n=1 Tax=Agrilus planipennis TaxID=224129 RepID=A0A1W4WG80_AGRPL|nr:lebercilin-like protein [Agrilus planipennis]
MSSPGTARKPLGSRNSSRETIYSSNPSCLLHKRKPIVHPLAASIRVNTKNNNLQQRVLSAKLLKLKQIQNQLNDANHHLAELQQENRALKTLQARQEKALAKYEGTNAELPRLLQSYEEEVRILQSKNKTLRKGLKEAGEQLKAKDEEISNLREQLKHLTNLSKDRHLEEREKLAEQIDELKLKLHKSEEEITNLNRKSILDNKNYKYKINTEISKTKQYQKELQQAFNEIDKLNIMIEGNIKGQPNTVQGKKRFGNIQKRQSTSLVNLEKDTSASEIQSNRDDQPFDDAASIESKDDIKLEPLLNEANNTKPPSNVVSQQNGYLESPTEKIKARLSGKREDVEGSKIPTYTRFYSPEKAAKNENDLTRSNSNLGKLMLSEKDIELLSKTDNENVDITTISLKQLHFDRNRLNIIGENLKSSIRKGVQLKDKYALDENLEGYCSSVINSVHKCSDSLEKQLVTFEQSKAEMDKVLSDLDRVDQISQKLTSGSLQIVDKLEIPSKDVDIVNEILKDEYVFQKEVKKDRNVAKKYDFLIAATKEKHKDEKKSDVGQEDKRKLLETLRAIDDGEDVNFTENIDGNSVKKNNLMKELFGQASK